MYVRLCRGKSANKRKNARKFGVDEHFIQRDINDICAFLVNRIKHWIKQIENIKCFLTK